MEKKWTTEVLTATVEKLLQEQQERHTREKIRVTFKKPVKLKGKNRWSKTACTFDLKFFPTKNGLAYALRGNSTWGRYITDLPMEEIESVEKIPEMDWAAESQRIVGRFHDNVWTSLKAKLSDDGSYLRDGMYGNTLTCSITGKFPQFVIEELKEAFAQKKDYTYKTYGQKRDLSVTTKLGEDGEFRAWFSSEYAGCGNGDYWLLINPTTAAFKETD